MDSSIINKEGIEKLLTMLPSEEEVSRIEEAQEVNPELPLGTAEQFLITLSSRRPEERMEDISLQDSEDMDCQLYFERSVLVITIL